MSDLPTVPSRGQLPAGMPSALPRLFLDAGEKACWRFIEFFTANIRNRNTRLAYARAVGQFFAWCELHRIHTLQEINPVVIGVYIETHPAAAPTVKQHLAALYRVLGASNRAHAAALGKSLIADDKAQRSAGDGRHRYGQEPAAGR